MYILILFVLAGLLPDFSTACGPDPSKWTPQERQMYECLKSKGWSNEQMMDYYNRVFKPETRSGRATRRDQAMVRGCLTPEDFLRYGVTPEGYTTTTEAPPLDTFSELGARARGLLFCLRALGFRDQFIRDWYNRALNPSTRSGIVSISDQQVAINCIQPADYFTFGVTPDGYTTTTTTTTTQAPETTAPPPRTTTAATLTAATAREQTIFDCLKSQKGWNVQQMKTWYDRVMNPMTRTGRATMFDQDMVRGCVDVDDFLYYGVNPDGYIQTTPPPSGAGQSSKSNQPATHAPKLPPPPTVSGNLPPSSR